jgi:hypothetical protein
MKLWRLIVFLLAGAEFVLAQAPFLRVDIAPAKSMVGQPVRVTVDVLVPNFFTGAPEYPQFELNNAIVVLSEGDAQHINTTEHGVFYAGIRRTYTIYPEQSGDFTLPPAQIRVRFAAHPPETAEAVLSLPPRTFRATIPLQAQGLDYFLPTTALHLTQKWNTTFKGLKAGDSFERSITVTTARMQAMFIPPLPFDAPDGIRVYVENPSVDDLKTDRGEFVEGRRAQRATYLIEKQGQYSLPAIEIRWWDLAAGRIRTSTLPAVTITAAANPEYVAEMPPEAAPALVSAKKPNFWNQYKRWIYRLLSAGVTFLVAIWIVGRYASPVLVRWRAYRRASLNSESACFHRLARACRENRAADTYRYLLLWIAKSGRPASLETFLKDSADPDLSAQISNLTAALFSDSQKTVWSGQQLLAHLKRHRTVQSNRTSKLADLPVLNP